jgi:hypothetical protein
MIRAICAESGPEDGFMTAHCKAKKDAFKGKPMIKRANHTNSVKHRGRAGGTNRRDK